LFRGIIFLVIPVVRKCSCGKEQFLCLHSKSQPDPTLLYMSSKSTGAGLDPFLLLPDHHRHLILPSFSFFPKEGKKRKISYRHLQNKLQPPSVQPFLYNRSSHMVRALSVLANQLSCHLPPLLHCDCRFRVVDMELPCLALLVFFGTLLVLPQASVGTTRYYTFNVRLIFLFRKRVLTPALKKASVTEQGRRSCK
jgi:hypothetical protein